MNALTYATRGRFTGATQDGPDLLAISTMGYFTGVAPTPPVTTDRYLIETVSIWDGEARTVGFEDLVLSLAMYPGDTGVAEVRNVAIFGGVDVRAAMGEGFERVVGAIVDGLTADVSVVGDVSRTVKLEEE